MKLHVYGLFGGTNFGDELFAKYIVDRIHEAGGFSVPYLFTEDEAWSRRNVADFVPVVGFPVPNAGLRNWWRGLRSLRNSGGLLFGGGGLFNEVFLRADVVSKAIVLAACKLYGVPYIMHGIEIGYVGSRLNRWLTGWALRNAERVICRNRGSRLRAREVYGMRVKLGADINQAWLLDLMATDPREASGRPRFVINLQHSLDLDDDYARRLIEQQRAAGYSAVFLTGNEAEGAAIRDRFGDLVDELILAPTVASTARALRSGDAFLTERFHYTMAALHSNRPTYVIVSSTKVRQLLERLTRASVPLTTLRGGGTDRTVLYTAGSPEQAALTAEWGRTARQQLTSVLRQFLSRPDADRRSFRPQYIPLLVAFYTVFVWYYLLDRFFPLRRHLDLNKT